MSMYVWWLAARESGDHLAFKPHSSNRADQSHEEQATSGILESSTVGTGQLEGTEPSVVSLALPIGLSLTFMTEMTSPESRAT